MDRNQESSHCDDCERGLSRRDFVATAAGAAFAATALPSLVSAAPSRKSKAETAVKALYHSLTDDQRQVVALPIDDPRRTKVNPNWHITKANVGKFFDKSQQDLIDEIFRSVTSEEGYEKFIKQMADDMGGGFKRYSVALFGNPIEGPFEFELTGRHHTIRADGNSIEGLPFGGPIVYGHSKRGNSEQNLFSYQTKRANEVFQALEGEQRKTALLQTAPDETAVQLRKDLGQLPGVACGDLTADVKQLVEATLKDILLPYRKEDIDEVMEIVKAGGGMDKVHIAFYQSGDLDKDTVWDVWRLEGPTMVCHFRGAPHVHAYINVAKRES